MNGLVAEPTKKITVEIVAGCASDQPLFLPTCLPIIL